VNRRKLPYDVFVAHLDPGRFTGIPQILRRSAEVRVRPDPIALAHARRALDHDVNVLNLEASLHLDALRNGRAVAAISYQPLAGSLKKAGFHVVFDSTGLSDELFDVLVVRASTLNERPAQVDALIAGWRDGLRALQRDKAAVAADMARGTDMTPEEYLDTLGGLTFFEPAASLEQISGQQPPLVHGAERLVQTLIAADLLEEAPDWRRLIDPEPARRVMNAGKPS
jgi:NitT/TauT family transport system substrate-binding protein